MTQEELYEIYEEISSFLYNNRWCSYYVWYICGDVKFISDNIIEFDVYASSDQGDGDQWTENWSIDSDGKIYTKDNVYNNIEDFKRDW